jgi:hypothetical protein
MTRGFYSKSTNSLCSFIMLFIAKETVRIDSGVFFRAFLLPYVLHRAEPRILLGYRLPAAGRAHTNDAAFFAARMARILPGLTDAMLAFTMSPLLLERSK